jgi:hypothetical protein
VTGLWPLAGSHPDSRPTEVSLQRGGVPLLLIVGLLIVHQLIPAPAHPVWQALHQSAHGLWFALVTWVLCALVQLRWLALA